MSILVDQDTRVLVQGITGSYGRAQTKRMLDYGTKIVAGVSPNKSNTEVWGVPVYGSVAEAAEHAVFNAAVLYIPPVGVAKAAMEEIEAGAKLLMISTEGVPLHDSMRLKSFASEKGAWIVGPNSIGMISPGKCLVGSLAAEYALPGHLGVVTRGGTIAIEMVRMLSEAGLGQSTCVGSGGDKVIGRNPVEYLKLMEQDPDTHAILLAGEIGGMKENECADYIRQMHKPVYAYVLGECAPKGARMGHIGAIISKNGESHEEKCRVLAEAGATVVSTPWELIERLKAAGLGGSV